MLQVLCLDLFLSPLWLRSYSANLAKLYPSIRQANPFFSTEVNFQNILDNLVVFPYEFAEEEYTMLQHVCLSQFSINTLIIATTSYLVLQYFSTTLLYMAVALEFCVAHIILMMPGLFCDTLVCSTFREIRTGVPFLICTIWTEADWHTFCLSIFFMDFQFVYVKMKVIYR